MQAVLPSHFRMRMLPGFSRMLWRKPGEVYYIGGADVLPNPLSPQQESAVIESLTKEDSQQARASLIEHNLRLVVYIAQKFDNTGVGMEDLISIGTIGLIKGVDSFREDKKIRLATYCARCVENEILMYLRSVKKTARDVYLFDTIGSDKEGNEINLFDVLEYEEEDIADRLTRKEHIGKLEQYMEQTLTPREKEILCLRYGIQAKEQKTQREIAEIYQISRSYVSRIEKKALKKLRDRYEDE